jgi:hypothetical protein
VATETGDDRSDTGPHIYSEREVPDVSVIVVSYNTAHLLGRMFDALEASQAALRIQVARWVRSTVTHQISISGGD